MPAPARRRKTSPARTTINLRASADDRALIDRAAYRLGKSRTEFMLDSARDAARNALLDQQLFFLDAPDYDRFVAALDAPVEPTEALKKLLAAPSPWER